MGEVTSLTQAGIMAAIADAIAAAGGITQEQLDEAIADFVTQAAIDGTVATAVAALVNSAPSTLNQLNELATAIGNDPNFATTLATSLAGKASLVAGKVPVGEIPTITAAMVHADVATQAELDAVNAAKATPADIATAVSAHEADTTNVHGFADTNGIMRTVVHGASATTARPAGGASIVVHWIGSVAPTNAIDNDVWTDNS